MSVTTPATGELDQYLQLQSWDGTQNAQGAPDYSDSEWTSDGDMWGKIETLTGLEIEQARQLSAQATSRITVHFHTEEIRTPTAKKRFLHSDGRVFYIGHVANPDERNARRLCLCGDVRS